MDPLGLTKDIVQFILNTKQEKSEKAIAYLRAVAEACRELTAMQDIASDNGTLAHERLKRIYKDASKSFPHNFDPYGSFVLFNALSAVRIYYWIRRWEAVPDARLELAGEAGFREDLYEGSSPDTLAREVRRFLEGEPGSAERYRDALESVKHKCLGDIAALDTFTLELAARGKVGPTTRPEVTTPARQDVRSTARRETTPSGQYGIRRGNVWIEASDFLILDIIQRWPRSRDRLDILPRVAYDAAASDLMKYACHVTHVARHSAALTYFAQLLAGFRDAGASDFPMWVFHGRPPRVVPVDIDRASMLALFGPDLGTRVLDAPLEFLEHWPGRDNRVGSARQTAQGVGGAAVADLKLAAHSFAVPFTKSLTAPTLAASPPIKFRVVSNNPGHQIHWTYDYLMRPVVFGRTLSIPVDGYLAPASYHFGVSIGGGPITWDPSVFTAWPTVGQATLTVWDYDPATGNAATFSFDTRSAW
jgi:hypothetical protein